MLFYEHGYVYDTLDGTVEKAIPELIAHAHALGINIKGLNGEDWRNANLLRLKTFHDDLTIYITNGYLSVFRSSATCNLKYLRLSEYFKGFDSSLVQLDTNVTLVLDNTIKYSDFRIHEFSGDYKLDLTELNLVNASIVFNSAMKNASLDVFSECDADIICKHLKVRDEHLRVLSLYVYLLHYIRRDLHYCHESWHTDYKTDVLPLFQRHINAALLTSLSLCNLDGLSFSDTKEFMYSAIRSSHAPERIKDLAYLALGYEEAFGFIPDNLLNAVIDILYKVRTLKRGNK